MCVCGTIADMMRPPTQVLYDGQCPLCQRSVEGLRARDTRRALRVVDLHAVELNTIHPSLTREACLAEMHVVTPDGRALKGFHAFRHVWGRLPATAWLAPFLYIPGVSTIGQLVYRWVARRRYRFNAARCDARTCTLHAWHKEVS